MYNSPKSRSQSQSNFYRSPSERDTDFNERETGVVEKLLHSYGFIQCCDRDMRIFFHYSQFRSDIEDLQVGDSVEFGVSCDARSRKPVAVNIKLLPPGSASFEIYSEDKMTGIIDAEPKTQMKSPRSPSSNGYIEPEGGRICYERKGEIFYLNFSLLDCANPAVPLHTGDKVQFIVATDKRSGIVRAKDVELVESAKAEKYQGVVSSMKESFGFIERADKVSEIFFHYSEFLGDINDLMLGDDVEFTIQPRNGKEVAVRVEKLPEGTVTFEDISEDTYTGVVDKALSKSVAKRQHDPLHGKILYESDDGTDQEIVFSERDLHGEFTLRPQDVVEFNIAVDRRDFLKRATNIRLVKVADPQNGELREMGWVTALKEGFGFIRCCDRDARMFFHYSELLDSNYQVQIGDEVEFMVSEDMSATKRLNAIRVRVLPKGTIKTEDTDGVRYVGFVEREPAFAGKSPRKQDSNRESESGLISFEVSGRRETVTFDWQNSDPRRSAQFGDKVEFSLCESNRTGYRRAVGIEVIKKNSDIVHQGFVATLKENYGFLETAEHDKEVFFHYSEFDDDPNTLNIGDEVEYTLKMKNFKVSAEGIVKLTPGTITQEEMQPEIYTGKVVRPLRRADPQQLEYSGLIECLPEEASNGVEDGTPPQTFTVEYGITSLVDKKTVLQCGDKVRFKIGINKQNNSKLAMEVTPERNRVRALVESIKGQFGFIAYENDEGKNLFFHISEVADDVELQPGDEVEFYIVQKRGGKLSAIDISRISEFQRPGRLQLKQRSVSEESNKNRFEAIRKPFGPDGTRGFTYERTLKTNTLETNGTSAPQDTQFDSTTDQEENEGDILEELVAKLCDQD